MQRLASIARNRSRIASMKQKGKSTLEIRNYIDNKYKEGYGKPTPTPMPKLKKRGHASFFIHFFLTNSFKCISLACHTLYITLGKEGTQCKHITTMIKLSITRIAVIGINYSFYGSNERSIIF